MESVLAAPMAEGVGSIHRPGLVAKTLQVSCQVMSHHGGCLVTKKKRTGPRRMSNKNLLEQPVRITYYGFSHDHSIVVHLQEQGSCLGIVSSIDPSQVDECTLWTNPWINIIDLQTPDMSNSCLYILSCLHGHIEI